MNKEQLKKSLESLNIWCVNKNVTRKGKLDKYSVLKLMEVFEEIGIEKIYGFGFQEVKINKKNFSFYIENTQINSFIGCSNICGFIELPFKIRIKNKHTMDFKVRECVIINFE